MAQWVIGGDFDEDDPDAVGVLDRHFSHSPGLGYRLTQNANGGRSQPLMLGVNIPHLEPDHHHRVPGSAVRVPGDFQKACAEKEDHPGLVGESNSREIAKPSTSRQKWRLRPRSAGRNRIRLLSTSTPPSSQPAPPARRNGADGS